MAKTQREEKLTKAAENGQGMDSSLQRETGARRILGGTPGWRSWRAGRLTCRLQQPRFHDDLSSPVSVTTVYLSSAACPVLAGFPAVPGLDREPLLSTSAFSTCVPPLGYLPFRMRRRHRIPFDPRHTQSPPLPARIIQPVANPDRESNSNRHRGSDNRKELSVDRLNQTDRPDSFSSRQLIFSAVKLQKFSPWLGIPRRSLRPFWHWNVTARGNSTLWHRHFYFTISSAESFKKARKRNDKKYYQRRQVFPGCERASTRLICIPATTPNS